jgi:hypothetical protein
MSLPLLTLCFPGSHNEQIEAAIPLYRPTTQSVQAELSNDEYFPASHGRQKPDPASPAKNPLSQCKQPSIENAPETEIFPTLQSLQVMLGGS